MAAATPLNRREALWLGGAAALALPLAGCGKSAPAETDINIVMTAGLSGLTVHEVARAQGFFTQMNVSPKVLQVSDGGKCVAALVSGAAKLCAFSGFNQLIPAIEKGAPVKILAGALNLATLAMYTARDDIRSVKDLEGKTLGIGAPGSVLHQMTTLVLQKHGVDVSKVQFRNVGGNADVLKAVIAKTIDAGPGDVDIWEQQAALGIHALEDGLLWKEIPEYTNQATYASDKAIAADRDLLVRTMAAYAKAYRYISSPASRDAFVKAREAVSSSKETSQALTQWNWIQQNQPYATDLGLSDERINFVQKLNMEFQIQKRVLAISQLADRSLAQEAIKKLG